MIKLRTVFRGRSADLALVGAGGDELAALLLLLFGGLSLFFLGSGVPVTREFVKTTDPNTYQSPHNFHLDRHLTLHRQNILWVNTSN